MKKEDLNFLEDYYGEDVQSLVCEYKRLSKELKVLKEEKEENEKILLNAIECMARDMLLLTRKDINNWEFWDEKEEKDPLFSKFSKISYDGTTFHELFENYYIERSKKIFNE